jgi:hypothetical protein
MPYLYCADHGREVQIECQAKQEEYRQLGEAVLVVSGRLISGPWRCDRCNSLLTRGDLAFLVTSFSRYFAEDLAGYDYPFERKYFSIREAKTGVYGATPRT